MQTSRVGVTGLKGGLEGRQGLAVCMQAAGMFAGLAEVICRPVRLAGLQEVAGR